MADKKLNEVSTASDGAYVYAEDSSGNQIKISKADLATVVAGILGFKPLNAGKYYELPLNSPITILEGDKQGGFIFATTTALMAGGALFRVPPYGTVDAELVWGDTSVFNSSAIHMYRTEKTVFINNQKYPDTVRFQFTVIGY